MSLGESYWHLSLFLFSCLICLRLPHILYRWRSKYGETLARVAFCTQTPAELCGPRLQANVVSMSQMSQESPGITRNPVSSNMDMFRTCFCGNSVLSCFTMFYHVVPAPFMGLCRPSYANIALKMLETPWFYQWKLCNPSLTIQDWKLEN